LLQWEWCVFGRWGTDFEGQKWGGKKFFLRAKVGAMPKDWALTQEKAVFPQLESGGAHPWLKKKTALKKTTDVPRGGKLLSRWGPRKRLGKKCKRGWAMIQRPTRGGEGRQREGRRSTSTKKGGGGRHTGPGLFGEKRVRPTHRPQKFRQSKLKKKKGSEVVANNVPVAGPG